jgi:hypothetical protein
MSGGWCAGDPLVRAISLERAAALARGAKQADDI